MARLNTALLLFSMFLAASAAPARGEKAAIERLGLYVVVTDVEASTLFYEALFQQAPSVRGDHFVGFTVAGGLYALVSRAAYAPDSRRGDNVVPYLRVADIAGEYARVRALHAELLSDAIVVEGPISLFRFADPDGNVIEFFSLAAPAR